MASRLTRRTAFVFTNLGDLAGEAGRAPALWGKSRLRNIGSWRHGITTLPNALADWNFRDKIGPLARY
jgi:hypothetical protein